MSISNINSNLFFNPTIGTTYDTSASGISNTQLFFNPSVGSQSPAYDISSLSSGEALELESEIMTYNMSGTLFCSSPLSSITPSFGIGEQTSLLNQISVFNAVTPELLSSTYGLNTTEATTFGLDVSA